MMSILNDSEKDEIIADVKEMIESFGVTGARYTSSGGENLYGDIDGDFVTDADNAAIPVSIPTKLAEKDKLVSPNADVKINLYPDQTLNAEDRIEIEGTMYTVLTIRTINCFGAVNHQIAHLAIHR